MRKLIATNIVPYKNSNTFTRHSINDSFLNHIKRQRGLVILTLSCLMIFCLTGCKNSNEITQRNIEKATAISTEAVSQASNSVAVNEVIKKQPINKKFEEVLVEYKNYVASLNKDDIKSILLGIENYKKYVSDNKANNDKLFDVFDGLYSQCVYKKLASLDKYLSYTDEELSKYGLVHWENIIIPDESFMYNTFGQYLSKGKAEFLRLSFKESKNRYFRDGRFSSTLDNYSDSIYVWENYSKIYGTYPEYKKEVKIAKDATKERVMDYLNRNNDLDIYIFQSDLLSTDAQKSFLRFARKYPDSAYKKIILDYYDLLKGNNFEYSKKAEKYLKSKGLFIKDSKSNKN